MSSVSSEIKRWLLVAREDGDNGALARAFEALQSGSDSLGTSSELLTLCCEEAIALGAWPIAAACGEALKDLVAPTHALQARALFCAALLRLHDVPAMLRGEPLVDECALCMSLALRGVTMLVGTWPQEAETMLAGLGHLWHVMEPLYVRGFHRAIVDVVEFVTSLFERLMIGGGYNYVQWVTRYATCLRGVGRQSEAVAQLHNAAEAAQRLGDERLHVQVLRILAVTAASRDASGVVTAKTSGRGDAGSAKAALQHVINTTQCFLSAPGGPVVSAALPDLQLAFDALGGGSAEASAHTASGSASGSGSRLGGAAPSATAAPTSAKSASSSKPKAARTAGGGGGGGGASLLDGLSIGNAAIREELFSDVVLCLSVCGDVTRCELAIPVLLHSQNLRAKTFGSFAKVVLDAHAAGLLTLQGALDASYVTDATRLACTHCIRVVEDTLESAKMIADASERAYAVRAGCALLWVLCMPLLQADTRGQLRHTLARVVRCLAAYPGTSAAVPLQVRAEYESALAEFDEDNLSVAIQQIQQALSRGTVVAETALTTMTSGATADAGAAANPSAAAVDARVSVPMDFPLLWLLRRAQMRQVSDPASLDSDETQALHSLEQSKLVGTASKRLALLKACANKLPPLLPPGPGADQHADDVPPEPAAAASPRKVGTATPAAAPKRGPSKSRTTSLTAAPLSATLPPRRSLAELYAALLEECCRVESELGPSLIPIAKSTAESLCAMPIAPDDALAGDYLRIKAEAALSLAKVLCKEEESFKEALEKAAIRPQIVASLLAASELSSELYQRGYSSGWIAVSACQLYLNWRATAFVAGDLSGGVCAEVDALYSALWRCGVDSQREWALVGELALLVVVTHTAEYFSGKSDDARATAHLQASSTTAAPRQTAAMAASSASTSASLRSRPFDETVHQIQMAPKGEPNNVHLKRALEVCAETIDRIDLPSHKVSLLLLYPALCRLCASAGTATGKTEQAMLPQAQLLVLLGRLQGPMASDEERRTLLETQCMELLRADPSVELCGRVALTAHELREERLVIAVCELAQDLYQDGKLGWGTRFAPASATLLAASALADADSGATVRPAAAPAPPNASAGSSSKKALSHTGGSSAVNAAAAAAAAAQAFTAVYPRPGETDWMWFSRVQLLQAGIYQQRVVGMHAENRDKVNLRVLQLCTNAAIAATRGQGVSVYTGLRDATVIYAATIPRLLAAECDPALLHPSLKMMLSAQILTPLGRLTRAHAVAAAPGAPSAPASHAAPLPRPEAVAKMQEEVTAAVVTIGQAFLRCCAALAMLNESVAVLEQLFRFLPARFHKVFKVEDVRIRCQLGLSTTAVTRSARNDDPETEASVWVAVAQYTTNPELSVTAWKSALGAVARHPRPKAGVLLALAEHLMVTQSDTVPYSDVKTILLSALDNVEGVTAATLTQTNGAQSTTPPLVGDETGRDQRPSMLQLCGLGATANSPAGIGSSFRGLARRSSASKFAATRNTTTANNTMTVTNASGTARSDVGAPRTFTDTLLALRIAYCLFTIADPFPQEDASSAVSVLFKEDVALLVSHYVEMLWRLSRDRVTEADGRATGDAGAASLASADRQPSPPPAAVQLPDSLDDWFGFRAPVPFVRALEKALTTAEREALGACGVIGPLFRVARYFADCGRDTHSFLLYSWLDLCAQATYPAEDPRGAALQRAACAQAHLCAVRCGAGKLGMVYDVAPATTTHWRKVEEQLRVRGSSGSVPNSPPADSLSSQPHRAVETQRTLGALADVLLYEAEALAAFGQVEEAALIATCVGPWAESRGDAFLVGRSQLLLAARHAVVDGAMGTAAAGLDARETPGTSILAGCETEGVVRWYVEKVALLVQAGDLAAIARVTDSVEAAAARLLSASATQPREVLSATLARMAARVLTLQYASEVTTLLCREDIDVGGWCTVAEGASAAHSDVLRREVLRLLSHLGTSQHVLHRVQVTLTKADPLVRGDYSVRWAPLTVTPDTVQAALETLAEEDGAITALVDALRGDGALPGGESGSASPSRSGVALCTAYTCLDSRLSRLRAHNDLGRLRLTDWVLRRYRSLSMEELGLPTGGPPELEKHVLQFVRDPVQPSDTTTKDTTLLQMDWNSYGHGEVPDEVKNAFAHFSLPVSAIASASRVRADVAFRAALDAVPSGPGYTYCLERFCTLEAQRMFEESLEASHEHGLDVSAALEAALAATWSALPQFQMPEKASRHGKGADKAKRATTRTGSIIGAAVAPSRSLTEPEQQLATRLRELLFLYQHEFAFHRLYVVSVILANACAYWQRASEAAVAVETAQAAQLCDLLFGGCRALFSATSEAKLWRKFEFARLRMPAFPTSTAFARLRQDLLHTSPALVQMSALCSCADASAVAAGTAMEAATAAAHGTASAAVSRTSALAAQPPFARPLQDPVVDGAVLTVASAVQPNTFLVSLRTFDGAVYVRRVRILQSDLAALKGRLDGAVTERQTRAILAGPGAAAEREAAAKTMSDFLRDTAAVLQPLWSGFEEVLVSTSPRQQLFLCLSPELAPLPIEHVAPFNALYAVQRELGVPMIQTKQGSKTAKGSVTGSLLLVVDPYGDSPSSVQTVCPTDGKGKHADVLTAVNGARPFSDTFLAFKLASTTAASALLIDTCGSASTTLSPAILANLRLEHLGAAVVMDGGVTDTSLRRDQRQALGSDGATRLLTAKWVAPLLLLARGVRSVATSTFPLTPSDLDTLSKRAAVALSSGRSALEACVTTQAKSKGDGRQKEYITLYGVSAVSSKAK